MSTENTTKSSPHRGNSVVVSVSMPSDIRERIRTHAAKTGANFSATICDLALSGMAAQCVPRGQPCRYLLSDIVDRLSKTGGVSHIDPSLYHAWCPVTSSASSAPHRLFLFAEAGDDTSLEFDRCDLLCAELHSPEEILLALGLNPHALCRADAREIPTCP
jgi:hypothetical protein